MTLLYKPALWTRDQFSAIVEGVWWRGGGVDWQATGVTRRLARIQRGDLYIPARKECGDALARVQLAASRGAVAVVLARTPPTTAVVCPVFQVADTSEALQQLARASRARMNARVIAVTGSVGKTSVKDALAFALSQQGPVTCNRASENDVHAIGEVLAQTPPQARYMVAEVGMLGPSSIANKAAALRPDVAVITGIGTSHRAHHGSRKSIARTKADVLDSLERYGTAVLPRDSAFFEYLLDRSRATDSSPNVITFGRHDDSDMRLVSSQLHANTSTVTARFRDLTLTYELGLRGQHQVINSLSVLAAVAAAGGDLQLAAAALSNFTPSFRRGERFRIPLRDGVCECIDDSWNASPESVRAAINTLAMVDVPSSGRRMLVLGDMLELGQDAERHHAELAAIIATSSVDCVHTAGPLMRHLHESLPATQQGEHFETSQETAQRAGELIRPGDVVLVKGSNATAMWRVVSALMKGKTREGYRAPRHWSLAEELKGTTHADRSPIEGPCEEKLPQDPPTTLLNWIRSNLADASLVESAVDRLAHAFQQSSLPAVCWGVAITLYQAGVERLMVVRAGQESALENIRQAMRQVPKHTRFNEFNLEDWNRCRIQLDFIVDEPEPIDLANISESVLPQDEHGNSDTWTRSRHADSQQTAGESSQSGNPGGGQAGAPWQVQVVSNWLQPKQTRFEMGVDGLRIIREGKRRYFLPGDAFVRSILGMGQLRRHIQRLFPGEDVQGLTYYRFRSRSFVSGVQEARWLPLHRGLPPLPDVTPSSLTRAARAGAAWIADNLQPDGRFTYYYDAATDTQRDHEHPARDPATDPYYNLLRHGGGIVTMLLDAEWLQAQSPGSVLSGRVSTREPSCREGAPSSKMAGRPNQVDDRRRYAEHAIAFYLDQLVPYRTEAGQEAAYAFYNRKAKLGGSGIGLYALALYQRLFENERYAGPAEMLANHLVSEINAHGEFRYYHVYLDRHVEWEENRRYFSFYYPGEAILGLSHYCRYVCASKDQRTAVYKKTHDALRFLIHDRPHLHTQHYQTLPSDSWLMMGINDLWDEPEFQRDDYKRFVFQDADQMVRLMYTDENALFPDYVGSFYYQYGDHPYPDGARAEGLLAAYQLALKVGDQPRIERYRHACNQVALATLRLCNTPESVYSTPNPERAIGGIRFKLTRQWFRVDTIQHVASFYFKLLATENRMDVFPATENPGSLEVLTHQLTPWENNHGQAASQAEEGQSRRAARK